MKTSSRSHSSKRKPKRSQKHSKKKSKSKREKIKKLKRRDYSISCSDDEDSLPCSSRGDDNGDRGKKRGRSSDRKKSRRDKKRNKKISLVNESSGDDSPRVKKSKRLKKDRSLDDKKKRRRECSVSSVSIRSRSGSGSERSDDSEGDIERKDKKVEVKERMGREKRSASKSRRRSRSSSSCSLRSGEVSTPKRLKSVIVVMKKRDVVDEQELFRDDRCEDEMVCEFDDDYPSKSNDSIDGVSGREAMPNLHDVSSKERMLDEPNREFFASDVKISEGLGIQKKGNEGTEEMTTQSTINDPAIGFISEVCTESAGTSRADLEATLRQKALENLLKRQGKLSAKIPGDEKSGYDIEAKKPSVVNAQHILHGEENINSVKNVGKGDGNIKFVRKLGKVVDDKHMALSDGNIKTEQKMGRGVDVIYTNTLPSQSVHKTEPSKHSDSHLLNINVETRLAGKGKVSGNVVNGRPSVSLSMPRKEFLGGKNTWKRQLIPQQDCQENLSTPREIINKDTTKQFTSGEVTEPTVSTPQETLSKEFIRDSSSQQFDSELNAEKVEADGRSDPSPFGGQSTNDKKSETNEENQFQQKTMSVMRGGEMVQVSYKVYIPTKTPALARRKLKR